MNRSQLNSLKRSQLQQLAKRESLKANLKNAEIIRLLLEKYPAGVSKLYNKPSTLKRPTSSLSMAKQSIRRSKRKSTAKSGLASIKAKEINLYARPTPDEPDVSRKGRDRSMAPPPTTPTVPFDSLRPTASRRLLTTPRTDTFFEPQAGSETGKDADTHDARRRLETNSTPTEAAVATSHQTHEMLRSLADIIDRTSLDPEKPSSILYRAKALDAILDTTIVPRMMRVDKDVKDIVYMRIAVEKHLGPQFKKGVLPEFNHNGVYNIRSHLSYSTPRLPSLERPREEVGDQGVPPLAQASASKPTRVQ